MIESVYRRKHYTGIIEILINTKDTWINYRLSKDCGLKLTHFYKSSGLFHDYETLHSSQGQWSHQALNLHRWLWKVSEKAWIRQYLHYSSLMQSVTFCSMYASTVRNWHPARVCRLAKSAICLIKKSPICLPCQFF